MATALIRKQIAPAATTLTTLYTTPAATSTVISSIIICNRSANTDTFRIANRLLGAAISDEMYSHYAVTIAGNTTQIISCGQVTNATDVISVYSTNGTLSFTLNGQENT